MKISEYIDELAAHHSTLVAWEGGQLVVLSEPPMPRQRAILFAGLKPQIEQFLRDGVDSEISYRGSSQELERLGFVTIGAKDDLRMTHVNGDAYGDRILAGLISEEQAEAEIAAAIEQRNQILHAMHRRAGIE